MQEAGADLLHVDVMDGFFVPNLTIGPAVVKAVRPHVTLPLDVHLMLQTPARYAEAFVKAGADIITFHLEADVDASRTLDDVHALGVRTGIVIKPNTPVESVFPLLPKTDVVMVMTVEPGFGGQKMIPETLSKVAVIRAEAQRIGRSDFDIEVDGGVDLKTVSLVVEAGANVLVAGSALYGAEDYTEAVRALRAAAEASAKAWA